MNDLMGNYCFNDLNMDTKGCHFPGSLLPGIILMTSPFEKLAGVETYSVGQIVPELKSDTEITAVKIENNIIYYFLSYPNLSEEEFNDFATGTIQTRLIDFTDAIFFLLKYGKQPWMDVAYTIHLSNINPDTLNDTFTLFTLLAEGTTGEIKKIRMNTMAEDFGVKLKRMLTEQLKRPYPEYSQYLEHIQKIHSRYTTDQLVKLAKKRTPYSKPICI